MYYYGARFYMPDLGRWGVVDPLGGKTLSSYDYVNNNPIKLIDPTGMEAEDWYEREGSKQIVWFQGNQERAGFKYIGDSVKRGDLHYAPDGNVYDDSPKGLGKIDNSNKVFGIEEISLVGKAKENHKDKVMFATDAALTALETNNSSFRLTNGAYNGNGFSPKYYSSGWAGGSRARITTYNVGKVAKRLGLLSFGVNTLVDTGGVAIHYNNPNSEYAVHPAKAGFNLGLGIYSIKVNPAAGLIYSGVEAFYPGGWFGDGINAGAIQDQSRLIEGNKKIVPGFNLYRDMRGGW